MSNLIEIYQKYCPYQITDHIQELEFTFDVERLRKELFKFIIDNKFGFSAVSLRLPQGATNYTSSDEMLETGAIDASNYQNSENIPSNTVHNKEYLHWHPQLVDSYIASLVPNIEKLCGLHIGRIRLGWLQPHRGYPMHCDLEPMRLHIPLFTNNLAYMIHNHELYHMQYGKLYHLITTNIHTAWNFGKLPRLHLIFSTYADDIVDTEIAKLTQNDISAQNFIDTIKNQGVDAYSLVEIFRIAESIEHFDAKTKIDILQEIKQITNLISKN
jgi:hypothetical protein